MNYDSYKEWAICACNGIIDNCNRMTSGNYMHNINAVKMTAKMIRDDCLPHLFETPQSPWISVQERLPEMRSNNNPFSERVYVRYVQTVNGEKRIFYAFDELQYICLSSGKIIGHEWCRHQNKYDRVTHWMPIPKLQEE